MVVVAVLKSSLKVVVGNVTPESIINSAIKWGGSTLWVWFEKRFI